MRRINEAYRVIVEELATTGAPSRQAPSTGRRMSPEEIDALSKSIGSDGPVDWFLNTIGWVGNAVEGVLAILFAIGVVVRLALGVGRRDFTVLWEHPELFLLLAILVVLGVRELWVRSRVVRGVSQSAD
jgi:hypothetical protein